MSLFSNPASGLAGKTSRKTHALTRSALNRFDKSTDRAVSKINLSPIQDRLDAASAALGNGLNPQTLTGGGLGINISSGGNIDLTRSPEAQNYMNALQSGLTTDAAAFGNLLTNIAPGYSQERQARLQQIENARQKQVGNLQDNLRRRGVAGASFAQDQIASANAEYQQQKDQAIAQSYVDEMNLTNQVLSARNDARLKTISQAFNQINFETGVGSTLLAQTQNNLAQLQQAQVDLAKLKAAISIEGQKAQADIVAGHGTNALNFAGLGIQQLPRLAELTAAGKAAQQQSIGSLFGSLLGNANLGTSSFGLGQA